MALVLVDTHSAMRLFKSLFRLASIVLVSLYLFGVYLLLASRGRLKAPCSLTRIIRARFRPPFRGELMGIRPEDGHCFIGDVPGTLLSDAESLSSLVVFEDGKPLSAAHVGHDEIRRIGNGRYSHWNAGVYFSASDNSDPTANGRRYTVEEVRA